MGSIDYKEILINSIHRWSQYHNGIGNDYVGETTVEYSCETVYGSLCDSDNLEQIIVKIKANKMVLFQKTVFREINSDSDQHEQYACQKLLQEIILEGLNSTYYSSARSIS